MELQAGRAVWVRAAVSGDDVPAVRGEVTAAAVGRVYVRFPGSSALPLGCAPGSVVALRVPSDEGTHVTTAEVLRVQSAPQVIIVIRNPEKFTLVPSREFFRVATKLPVVCTITASSVAEAVGCADHAAKTLNISAGGMALLTTLSLQVGDELQMSVSHASLRGARLPLELIGHVLRVVPDESKPQSSVCVGIKFVHRDQSEQVELQRLMYDLQRKSLS